MEDWNLYILFGVGGGLFTFFSSCFCYYKRKDILRRREEKIFEDERDEILEGFWGSNGSQDYPNVNQNQGGSNGTGAATGTDATDRPSDTAIIIPEANETGNPVEISAETESSSDNNSDNNHPSTSVNSRHNIDSQPSEEQDRGHSDSAVSQVQSSSDFNTDSDSERKEDVANLNQGLYYDKRTRKNEEGSHAEVEMGVVNLAFESSTLEV